jgi:hypothetical protein
MGSLMEPYIQEILQGKRCPYCHCGTELVAGDVIYPARAADYPRPYYLDKKFYICKMDRNHYVGTYADNVKSFGRLADTELRELKRQGHHIYDLTIGYGKLIRTQNIQGKLHQNCMCFFKQCFSIGFRHID